MNATKINAALNSFGYKPKTSRITDKSNETYGTSFADKVITASKLKKSRDVSEVQPSLEEMLKAKYPMLAYHVFDASTSYWKTRNDYPFSLIYRDNIDTKAIEKWKPQGPNPEMSSPSVQRDISSIPPGAKAVIIHPKVQEKMEQDPAYAKEIMERIDTWFLFDIARNEAIIPGITVGMSQSVAIGEDGNIVNAQSSRIGPGLTYSGDDDESDFWKRRSKKHALYMKYLTDKYIEKGLEIKKQFAQNNSSQVLKNDLLEMISSDKFKDIIGDTIAGMPVEELIDITRNEIFKGVKLPLNKYFFNTILI